jgi:hypothetical protein
LNSQNSINRKKCQLPGQKKSTFSKIYGAGQFFKRNFFGVSAQFVGVSGKSFGGLCEEAEKRRSEEADVEKR